MANITITIEGEADFNSKIQAIITNVEGKGLQTALMEGGQLIETACKQQAPVDTGLLRSSIQAEAQGENTVIVAPHTDYAMYVEFGTHGISSTYLGVTFRTSGGQAAQPYMKPGFESSRDAAMAHIKAKLAAAMKG